MDTIVFVVFLNLKKNIAIYGTGSSAEAFLKEVTESDNIVCFYETSPKKDLFKGYPVFGINDIKESIDEVFICSIYYPEIIESLIAMGEPLEKFTVVDDTLDNPRYGPKR